MLEAPIVGLAEPSHARIGADWLYSNYFCFLCLASGLCTVHYESKNRISFILIKIYYVYEFLRGHRACETGKVVVGETFPCFV
jgi:hypothetical protein